MDKFIFPISIFIAAGFVGYAVYSMIQERELAEKKRAVDRYECVTNGGKIVDNYRWDTTSKPSWRCEGAKP